MKKWIYCKPINWFLRGLLFYSMSGPVMAEQELKAPSKAPMASEEKPHAQTAAPKELSIKPAAADANDESAALEPTKKEPIPLSSPASSFAEEKQISQEQDERPLTPAPQSEGAKEIGQAQEMQTELQSTKDANQAALQPPLDVSSDVLLDPTLKVPLQKQILEGRVAKVKEELDELNKSLSLLSGEVRAVQQQLGNMGPPQAPLVVQVTLPKSGPKMEIQRILLDGKPILVSSAKDRPEVLLADDLVMRGRHVIQIEGAYLPSRLALAAKINGFAFKGVYILWSAADSVIQMQAKIDSKNKPKPPTSSKDILFYFDVTHLQLRNEPEQNEIQEVLLPGTQSSKIAVRLQGEIKKHWRAVGHSILLDGKVLAIDKQQAPKTDMFLLSPVVVLPGKHRIDLVLTLTYEGKDASEAPSGYRKNLQISWLLLAKPGFQTQINIADIQP